MPGIRNRLKRSALLVALVALTGLGTWVWVAGVQPRLRHSAFCREVKTDIRALGRRRPPDLSRRQWGAVVGWTMNAYWNTLAGRETLPQAERDRFLAEFRRRLDGPVDLGTIDWVWDEFARLSPVYGPWYSDAYRPTTPERLKEFEDGAGLGISVEVD